MSAPSSRGTLRRTPILFAICLFLVGSFAQVAGPAAINGPVTFENIERSSKISFVLDNSARGRKYQAETMAGGVAVFDYNNDGLLDIFFTNGALLPSMDKSDPLFYNRLYRNNGDGTFMDVTKESGVQGSFYAIGVATADYDNDGFPDLFVTGANGYQLYHNNGNGTFTDVTEKAGLGNVPPELKNSFSAAAGWFDYDNDGKLDLFVVNYLNWSPALDRVCEVKSLRSYCSPDSYAGLSNLLFHNNGDGTFTNVSDRSGISRYKGKGMGVAFADYDDDGFVDVFVSNDTFRNFLFHNNGNGTFTEVGLLSGVSYNRDGRSIAGMGVDFRDINNDGKPDIFETAMHGDTFPLYINLGGGFFEDATLSSKLHSVTMPLTSWGTGIFDFDNDGWKDIFMSNSAILDNAEEIEQLPYKQANTVLRNNHDGTFTDISASAGAAFKAPSSHRGAAFGDLNNDGRIDVVVNCLNTSPEIWMNRTQNGNHWLLVELLGTRSNRDGLGARLKLITAEGAQYNEATTSVGYGSSSDKRVHFGMNKSAAGQLEIRWPSGIIQVLKNVKADQILKVTEPM
jgi:hypothetical protein